MSMSQEQTPLHEDGLPGQVLHPNGGTIVGS